MPRSPGMRPLCHLSWAAPPPPAPAPSLVRGRQARGRARGRALGVGRDSTTPFHRYLCLGGKAHSGVAEGAAVSTAWPHPPKPSSHTGPRAPPGRPCASICCPLSAILSQRPSATFGTHSPLNILRGGSGATPAPLHSAWTWDLAGTVTSGDSSAEHRGSEGRDSWGANPNPREGRCAPSGTSRLYAEGLEELETRTLPGCCATVERCSHFGKVWQFFKP